MTEMLPILAGIAVVVAIAAVAVAAVVVLRSRTPAEPEADPMDGLVQAQNAAAQRLEAMIRMLGDRQSQLQHAVNERLDVVSHRLGDSIQKTTAHTTENLQKLHERLAVIDSAQKNITDARHAGHLAAKRARQQAVARRVRAVADGIDRSGLPAEGRLCIPAYAVEPHPPRLLRVHARQSRAGHRRQISARKRHRLSRRQVRRRAPSRRPAAADRRRQAHCRHRRKISDSGRDPGIRADVRAVGGGLCRSPRRLRRPGAEGLSRTRRA